GADADAVAFAQPEVRDRALGERDDRLLARDGGDVFGRAVERVAIGEGFAHADVDHDLGDAWHLHDVLILEVLAERRQDVRFVAVFHSRRHYSMSSPLRLPTRTLVPSSRCRKVTRVGS